MNTYDNISTLKTSKAELKASAGTITKTGAAFSLPDNRPQSVLQRKQMTALSNRAVAHDTVAQLKPHKPRVESQVRYPATGPGQGALYTVVEAFDDGRLRIQSGPTTLNINWKTDKIWLERAANVLDTDSRLDHNVWAGYTKDQKRQQYATAKESALTLLKTYVKPGMLNATNRTNLQNNLALGAFNKEKKGQWAASWEEENSNGRKWKLTIDMDDPLETSDQEPHVGWEVKLESRGTNGVGAPLADYAKGQGHVWLNEVPEARAPE